ncbi:MAG: MogA/MoaB family molybdenum cofactor biosynthesis protein [Coleofasciculus sp. C1-SOL-03]|jgi:molybdenum cofactor biosynthesis protein B|uniref:MogA/MoaB family molybdenum cofactor biosynthesis protein n=1 Tax=Coleofasciculus sp. C1-SOL-03 TaxID=3069522 RepID=UPI0033037FEE
MTHQPHPDTGSRSIATAVVTVSDTRSPDSDRSGSCIQQLLRDAGHRVVAYEILKDEPNQIQKYLQVLAQRSDIQAVVVNGGTGIAARDTTYDALAGLLEKTLPGFGEVFRWLSYQEIGSRAIASRAVAGVYRRKLIFSLPGSTAAVTLAMEKLILPELIHLVTQLES